MSLAGQAGGIDLAAHPLNNDNIMGLYTYNNTVKYESPKWSGPWGAFDFGGTYSFSNNTDFVANRAYSVGAGYAWGPLKFAAAYNQVNNDTYGFGGIGTGGATGAAPGIFGADVQRTFGAGVNYGFNLGGHAGSVGVLWTQTNVQGTGTNILNQPMGHDRFDNIEINGTYMITPALAAVADYTYTWSKGYANPGPDGDDSTAKWHSVTLGLDYGLSKRTDVYLAGVYQHASGNVNVTGDYAGYGSTYYNGASIGGIVPPSSTENQIGAAVGIRHRF
jgi:predicted porin